MRIDRIQVKNFKHFQEKELNLNPRFTLLVGENGAGKTALLDALAVAAGIWLVKPPDSALANSGRNILKTDIRLESRIQGDRTTLLECKPVKVLAEGTISNRNVTWLRQIRSGGTRTSNSDAAKAQSIIQHHFSQIQDGVELISPVIAHYGAGRSWLPSRNRRLTGKTGHVPARRWDAFYDCFEERIRFQELQNWFWRETMAFARRRKWRPGYSVVKAAVLRCVPTAVDLWYDGDRAEIVLSIGNEVHTLANLSAGQRTMVALVADIAIKVVTQNSHLIKDTPVDNLENLPNVLVQTPGLVLIDEIDAHLHPKWQRRVVDDLKNTFPKIQFVCTSHSPFVVHSLEPDELRTLDETGVLPIEHSNRSIEDIAEDIQMVEVPQ